MRNAQPIRTALGLALAALLLAGCGGGGSDAAATPSERPSKEPKGGDGGTTREPTTLGYDATVVAFCVTEERVVGIESQILQDEPIPSIAVSMLLDARQESAGAIPELRAAGRSDLIPAVNHWSHSFTQSIQLAQKDATALDTLRPAVKALNRVDKIQSCELDNAPA